MNVDPISWAAVCPDLLSGRVMMSVDPEVGCGDPMSPRMIPEVMEKFVLFPEVCPVGSMTSAAGPTFLPPLSEVYSPVRVRYSVRCLSCR